MHGRVLIVSALFPALVALAQPPQALRPDTPILCYDCAAWNAPREPFRLFGNTYYVGVGGLSAVLLTSRDGLVLLDGGLPQTAARIDSSIRRLGLKTEAIRLIVNSHAHYDHAGGIAALQRVSGAEVAASAAGARALQRGEPTDDDPQYALDRTINAFPAVEKVRVVADGETLRVGEVAITAHVTPGHTPGSTTWTWRSCEGNRCLDFVYADSLNPVSAPGFRFSGGGGKPSIVDAFRRSIATVAQLPCDVIVSVHPSFTDLDRKLKQRAAKPGADPFVDRQGCRAYAADAGKRLDARLAEEKKTP